MASKEDIKKRRERILKCLSEKACSISELSRNADAKKRTILDDISILRKSGNVIEIKNGIAALKEKTDVVTHSSKSVMRKIRIITLINREGGASRKQLFKAIKDGSGYYDDEQVRKLKIDAERKNLDNDLKALLEEGVIREEEDVYYTSISTPGITEFKDESLVNIYKMIINNGDRTSYSPVLYGIAEKIEEVLQYKLYSEPQKYVQSVLLRDSRQNIEQYEKNINEVWKLPFKTQKLHIQALNRYEQVYDKIIAVEKIVYLYDSGKLYLIGEEHNCSRRSIIDFSRITHVGITEFKNTIYDNKEIKSTCDEMLRISTGELHSIVVEFDNVQNAKENLMRYMRTRKNACLFEKDGKLIYEDRVRGIDDAAKMIRRYGKLCKVIEDEPLKTRIVASSRKIIERYESGE